MKGKAMSLTHKAQKILELIVERLKEELNFEDDQNKAIVSIDSSEQDERTAEPSRYYQHNHAFIYVRYNLFEDDQIRITECHQSNTKAFSVQISLYTHSVKIEDEIFTEEQLDKTILLLVDHCKKRLQPMIRKAKQQKTKKTLNQLLF